MNNDVFPRLDWVGSSISHVCCLDSSISLLVLRSSSLFLPLHIYLPSIFFSSILMYSLLDHLFDLLPSTDHSIWSIQFDISSSIAIYSSSHLLPSILAYSPLSLLDLLPSICSIHSIWSILSFIYCHLFSSILSVRFILIFCHLSNLLWSISVYSTSFPFYVLDLLLFSLHLPDLFHFFPSAYQARVGGG